MCMRGIHTMTLIRLINDIQHVDWDWNDLSGNQNITVSDVMSHPHYPWNFSFLLTNPSFSLEDIEHVASKMYQLRMDEVMSNQNYSFMISRNHSIPLDWFLHHDECYFSFYDLAIHPHASLELLHGDYADKFNTHRITMMGNSSIPIETILEHVQEEPHDVSPILSTHKGIQYEHVEEFPSIRWHWPTLSTHHNMTPDIVDRYSDKKWYTPKFWTNPSFYLDDIVRRIPDHHYTFYASTYSMNPNIRFEDIDTLHNIPWRWRSLSVNPGITIRDIRANPDKPWEYAYVSKNTFNPWKYEYTTTTSMERMKYTTWYIQGIKDELFAHAWDIGRMVNWCLDHQERDELIERWDL